MPRWEVNPEFLAAARGDAPADLVFRNARVVNVFTCEVEERDVAVQQGRIAGLAGRGVYKAVREINVGGAYLAPGFIDAHMHVESTMMPPSQFVKLALPHGTTGAVFDPHEIANVLGIEGIRYIMDDAAGLPFTALFALSSCVPSSPLETSGAVLEAVDLAALFADERVVALAELMNFPGVVHGVRSVLEKVNLGLRNHVVDGHAPGLAGLGLQAYVGAGISSDHECTGATEALEKLRAGQRIFIREGSAARNLDALLPIVNIGNKHRFCFCTDDRHPGDLQDEGHIDHVVRRAVASGLDPCWAVAMASLHVAEHFRRPDLGAIAPGRAANMVIFDDLSDIQATQVYHEGVLVAEDGAYIGPSRAATTPPISGVRLPQGLSEASLRIASGPGPQLVRVIQMYPDQIVTGELRVRVDVRDGAMVTDIGRDLLKLAVIERHRGTGNIGLGFVRGFDLKRGALASTVGHDAHNLAIVGTNDPDMLLAARTLAACGGGQCVVADGTVLAVLPLPIAGLLSDREAPVLIAQQRALIAAAKTLGYAHGDPFMPLSFLVLPVIPALKLTDRGLVDVGRFEVVPLLDDAAS